MPFTEEQFFQVFETYNQAVFPSQIVLILAAITAVILASRPKPFSNKFISLALTFFWLWSGIAYHLLFFTKINAAAYIFGATFIAQGLFLFRQGVWKKNLSFSFKPDFYSYLGAAFIIRRDFTSEKEILL